MDTQEDISVCTTESLDMSILESSTKKEKSKSWLKFVIFLEGLLILIILIVLCQLNSQQAQIIELLRRQNQLLESQQEHIFQFNEIPEYSLFGSVGSGISLAAYTLLGWGEAIFD